MWLFYLVPPLFFILGAVIVFELVRYRLLAHTIPGTIVGFEPSSSARGSRTLRPVVAYESRGKHYRFLEGVGSMPPGYELGESVTVLAYRALHGTARIRGGGRVIIGAAFLCFGAVGTAIALVQSSHPYAWSLLYTILTAGALFLTYQFAEKSYLESQRKYEEVTLERDGFIGYVPTDNVLTEPSQMARYHYSAHWHIVGLVLGAGLLFGGVYWGLSIQHFMANSTVVHGEIVSTERHTSRDTDGRLSVTLHAVIAYETLEGKRHRMTSRLGATDPGWKVGDAVRVHYIPGHGHAAMEESVWHWFFPIAMAVTGGVILLISIRGYRVRMAKERARKGRVQAG